MMRAGMYATSCSGCTKRVVSGSPARTNASSFSNTAMRSLSRAFSPDNPSLFERSLKKSVTRPLTLYKPAMNALLDEKNTLPAYRPLPTNKANEAISNNRNSPTMLYRARKRNNLCINLRPQNTPNPLKGAFGKIPLKAYL